jgi:hypothetical protein
VTAGEGSAVTGTNGEYEICNLRNGTYIVSPTKGGCTFEPEFTIIDNLTLYQTAINFIGDCEGGSGNTGGGSGGTTTTTTPPSDPGDNPNDDPYDDPGDYPGEVPDDPGNDPEVAQISIKQSFLIKSRWFIFPGFLTINGNNTRFDKNSRVTFNPRNAVFPLIRRIVDEERICCFILVMPSWFTTADAQQVEVKVTTGTEEAISTVNVKLLSTIFAFE